MTTSIREMPIEREQLLDPPLAYHQLREDQPIVRMRFPSGRIGWLVTRFEEGSQVFSDPRLSSQRPRHDVAEEDGVDPNDNDSAEALPPTFNSMDAPDHGAYRRLLSGKFTPKS
ncbi:cytochrome P450, partial [Streptomyces sp. DSM 41699]|nr:cytochrome P450 [Streptomyces sp. DSM 41699]